MKQLDFCCENIVFEKMQEDYCGFVEKLEMAYFSVPWTLEQIKFEYTNEYSYFCVGVLDGIPCCYGSFRFAGGIAYINNIAVEDEYRNNGIGRKLMEELECKSKELALESITLEVRCSNIAAIHLYEKLGYQNMGVRPSFYSNPKEDGIIMTKLLK